MLKFFFVITAIGVVFLGYPAFNEDESSSCAAYERRVLRVIGMSEGADNGLGGIGELIWLILLGLGIISMVVSISFFRKYD